MSTTTISMPSSMAWFTAWKATEAGSCPSVTGVTIPTPARVAQVVNCSTAAARNVSAAAISTDRPAVVKNLANFPMVVVFPTPFTPTTSTTAGRLVSVRVESYTASLSSMASRKMAVTSSALVVPMRSTSARTVATNSSAISSPKSAEMRVSSRVLQVSSSICASGADEENRDLSDHDFFPHAMAQA